MISKPQLASLATFILVAAPVPVSAQLPQAAVQEPSIIVTHKMRPSPDLMVRTVYIGDLDLKTSAGQQAMEKRVNAAVEEMCAIPTPIPGQERNMTRPCREEAWDSAKPQMADAVKRAGGPAGQMR